MLALFTVRDVYAFLCKRGAYAHLARSEGHERYFGCNLMHRNVLASSYQHLMTEAPIRLVRAYISYYHEDRCHLGLNKDTPSLRAVTHRPSPTAKVVALPRVGGLHHRYEWREAA